MYDFNAPVKYTPPEPAERNLAPLITIVVIVAAVLLVGGGAFAFMNFGSSSSSKRETRLTWLYSLPPAQVPVGQAKAWRTLAETKPVAGTAQVRPPAVVGHFDTSQEDEVLLIGMDTPTYVYHVDGKRTTVPAARFTSITRFTTWDYNHDGISELVPDTMGLAYMRNMDFPVISYGETGQGVGWSIDSADAQSAHVMLDMRSDYTPLYRDNGNVTRELSGGYTFGQILYGDLDGDHYPDMLIKLNKVVDTFAVFGGPRGDHLRDIKPQLNAKSCICGDLDGSGKDTLVNLEGGDLALYDFRGNRSEISGWPAGYYPTAAADLNGDHADEVIAINGGLETEDLWDQARGKFKAATPEGDTALQINEWWQKHCQPRGGYFNPKTKEWVNFKFPAGPNWIFNMYQSVPDEIAVGDFDHTGQQEVAVKASTGTALFIFDAKGDCVYYEEFGAAVFAMGKARSGGKDYLVVQTPDKLLIYP
jgi:hypothetical protein